jgi:hypothetical protein
LQQNKFRKVDFRDGVKSKSRFGLSLAGLGDINRDGYEGERAALILLMRRARGLFWKCVFLSQISPSVLLTTGLSSTAPSTSTMARLRVSERNIRRFVSHFFNCISCKISCFVVPSASVILALFLARVKLDYQTKNWPNQSYFHASIFKRFSLKKSYHKFKFVIEPLHVILTLSSYS